MLPIQKQAEQYTEAEEARDEALPEREPKIENFSIPIPESPMTATTHVTSV